MPILPSPRKSPGGRPNAVLEKVRRDMPVVLAANKAEGRAGDQGILEAFGLGLGEPVPISAEHGEGMADLYAALIAATLVYYCTVRNRTLGQWLSPGAEPPPGTRPGRRRRQRCGAGQVPRGGRRDSVMHAL